MEMVEHCTRKICDGTELPMLKLKSYNFQSKRDSAFWLIVHHHVEAQHPARLRPAHCSIHPKDAEHPGAEQNGGIYPTSLRQRKKKLHAAQLKWTDTRLLWADASTLQMYEKLGVHGVCQLAISSWFGTNWSWRWMLMAGERFGLSCELGTIPDHHSHCECRGQTFKTNVNPLMTPEPSEVEETSQVHMAHKCPHFTLSHNLQVRNPCWLFILCGCFIPAMCAWVCMFWPYNINTGIQYLHLLQMW